MKYIGYWWDFDKNFNVIVETTLDRYPIVFCESSSEENIQKAEKLIEDLYAGRIGVKNARDKYLCPKSQGKSGANM